MSRNSASPFTTDQKTISSQRFPQKSTRSSARTQQAYAQIKWQPDLNPISASNLQPQNAATSSGTPLQPPPSRKRRKLTPEEEEIGGNAAASFALNLAADHILALHPDVDTPFTEQSDVVNRLLPYHVFQHPKHDLDLKRGLKGKGKESETNAIKEELCETRFALQCYHRKSELDRRFRQIRVRSGKHPSPLNQLVVLTQSVVEADRAATSAMEQELAAARSEMDRANRAQRTTSSTSRFPASYPSYPLVSPGTSLPSMYARYPNTNYQAYTYPYNQSNGPQNTSSTSTQSSPPASTPTFQTPSGQTATSAAGPSSTSIPVQLPVSSLPTLQQYGILPVPKAALPPPSHPQPAAVLLGSTNNGTTLLLEINVSRLQATQMSGLAIILSGLMRKNTQSESHTSSSHPTTPDTTRTNSTSQTPTVSSSSSSITNSNSQSPK